MSNIQTGAHENYRYLTSDEHSLGDIVRLCPEAILGRYLAVTSTDSGEPRWWAEKLPGWECRGFIGYSPLMENFEGVLFQTDGPESPGFDEWWTFESPNDLGTVIRDENPWDDEVKTRPDRFLALVNFFYYPGNDENLLWEEFWGQIGKHQPESYISDGSRVLTFVSRNSSLFDRVYALLAADSS